jgi:hypothetical protein
MRTSVLAFVALISTACLPAVASPDLSGVWEAGDRAHTAIYGFLKLSSTDIQFSLKGKRWNCKTTYEIVGAGNDETYSEEAGPFPDGVRPWAYVKLRLGKSKCTQASHFVLAFLPDQPDYAGFVEFRNTSQWSGTGHFHRIYRGE